MMISQGGPVRNTNGDHAGHPQPHLETSINIFLTIVFLMVILLNTGILNGIRNTIILNYIYHLSKLTDNITSHREGTNHELQHMFKVGGGVPCVVPPKTAADYYYYYYNYYYRLIVVVVEVVVVVVVVVAVAVVVVVVVVDIALSLLSLGCFLRSVPSEAKKLPASSASTTWESDALYIM